MSNEELVELVQKGIDVQENLKTLYEQNKKYICKMIVPFMKYAEQDDLLQEAYIGFQEAVCSYKPGDAKLTTYATWKIRQHCIRYIENFSSTKRIPSGTYNLIRKYKSFIQMYQNECGTVPDDKTIMKELELTPKKLEYIREVIHEQHCISFSAKVSDTDGLTLEETLADDYDMESDIEDKVSREHKREILKNAIEQLKDNEQMVIESRYWKDMTQKHIAEDIKVSSARVGTIEKNALRKLKKNKKLQEIIDEQYGYNSSKVYHMSVKSCIDHHTSATEMVAIKRVMMGEKRLKN